MMDEVRIKRVIAGDQNGHSFSFRPPLRAPPLLASLRVRAARPACPARSARPAGLLPERGPSAWPASDNDGVQAGDVDAELQGGSRRQRRDGAAAQRPLKLATLFGQVPGAVGRDAVREIAGTGLG